MESAMDSPPVMVLGQWDELEKPDEVRADDAVELLHCTGTAVAPVVAARRRIDWILCGFGLGDQEMAQAVNGIRAVHPGVRLAVLGDLEDWRRCESWLRRGCQVYLDAKTTVSRLTAALGHAVALDVTITSTVFQRLQAMRRAGGVPDLTSREFDVLERLRQGLMNREIAGILHITENTVEYHMKNLLRKLGARNRLEVAERASALGL